MATLEISPLCPIHFRIETGAGTIHTGESIYNNYLYNETDVRDYYSCQQIDVNAVLGLEKFLEEVVPFQIQYENTPNLPVVTVEDGDGVWVETLTSTGGVSDFFYYEIDFSDAKYDTSKCYIVYIYSSAEKFTMGDNGTHEANVNNLYTGASLLVANTLAQSAAQAQSGTESALITAPAAPTNDHRFIYSNIKTSYISLTAGDIVTATAYVYIPSGNPWVAGNNITLEGDFDGSYGDQVAPATHGWTDATSVVNGFVDASVTDVWQLMTTTFVVGSVTDGALVITSDNVPTANAEIYVDTVKLTVQTGVLEATSETITICTSLPCSNLVTYSNNKAAFGIEFESGANEYFTRIEFNNHQTQSEDADFSTPEQSDNSINVNRARPVMFNQVKTELIPLYKAIRLQMAMKCRDTKVNGIGYITITPNWPMTYETVKASFGYAEFELRPKSYDYQLRN